MNFTFLSSLFHRKKTDLQLPDSLLVKKLKEICQEKQFLLFENKTIFHHSQTFKIPLFILDPSRGIYLFEYKEWSYDELKNATIKKAGKQEVSHNSLSFENTHKFIKQKFNELIHTDGVEIFNFLLMENLNTGEYTHLNESFQELLPKHRVMFHDSSKESIVEKLQNVKEAKDPLPKVANIIGNLLIQYAIYHEDGQLSLCTQEQREFIDTQLRSHETLYAPNGMGKTSLILLKALYEKLKNPKIRITIIQPTTLACDIVKQKLIHSIEHAMVTLDMTSIEVITPIELVNKHLQKLKKELLDEELILEKKLFKTSLDLADILFCDASDFYEESFLEYLKHIQKNSALLFVSQSKKEDANYSLSDTSFKKTPETSFHQGNELALCMHLLNKLLQTEKAKDILVVSGNLNKEKLHDDLKFFIKDKAILLDSSKNLIDLEQDSVLLCSYEEISGLRAKHVLLLDICQTDSLRIDHARSLADTQIYIIYEQKCEKTKELHNEHKNQQNTPRVERDT